MFQQVGWRSWLYYSHPRQKVGQVLGDAFAIQQLRNVNTQTGFSPNFNEKKSTICPCTNPLLCEVSRSSELVFKKVGEKRAKENLQLADQIWRLHVEGDTFCTILDAPFHIWQMAVRKRQWSSWSTLLNSWQTWEHSFTSGIVLYWMTLHGITLVWMDLYSMMKIFIFKQLIHSRAVQYMLTKR